MAQRLFLGDTIKSDNVYLGISDVARACKVNARQIRYWIKMGYIDTVNVENGAIKLPYSELIHARLIKHFLDEGYTLSAAAKKMKENIGLARAYRKILTEGVKKVSTDKNKTIFDFGSLKENPDKHVYGVETENGIEFTLDKELL
ncbi:MerR family transcriptional regulator [Lactobacillus sp. ESL0785]|uniref:MerR family transcriptional regulator n=1 Tax=unclassified Lactobacillus TaxID=2620435 RepID=UPI0023F99426|nr:MULTISPECIES: MerR family transcriptional regulator [unclassified Lactobacillus]WEV38712.1 MerR family transcriptional regulator [Lactobacillus sp. ESL0680]WEV70889.1 MerR family transcriptional regulator [Lactobacillus sp. ESL0785]